MDHAFFYFIAGGIALVGFFFVARLALRWAVRLVIAGLLLLILLGGAAWWWISQPTQLRENKPRATSTTKRTSSERR